MTNISDCAKKSLVFFGEEVIQCFCQKYEELLQLKANLKSEQEKAELTLKLTLELLHDKLVLTEAKQQKTKHSVAGFFSQRSMEKNSMLEVDITEEEMANSAFGQGSQTARFM